MPALVSLPLTAGIFPRRTAEFALAVVAGKVVASQASSRHEIAR